MHKMWMNNGRLNISHTSHWVVPSYVRIEQFNLKLSKENLVFENNLKNTSVLCGYSLITQMIDQVLISNRLTQPVRQVSNYNRWPDFGSAWDTNPLPLCCKTRALTTEHAPHTYLPTCCKKYNLTQKILKYINNKDFICYRVHRGILRG